MGKLPCCSSVATSMLLAMALGPTTPLASSCSDIIDLSTKTHMHWLQYQLAATLRPQAGAAH